MTGYTGFTGAGYYKEVIVRFYGHSEFLNTEGKTGLDLFNTMQHTKMPTGKERYLKLLQFDEHVKRLKYEK